MLWKDTVEKAPRSGLAWAGLTNAYRERGDLFLSAEAAEKGLAIDPNSYFIRVNLGRTYQLLGKTDQAITEYEMALRIDPGRAAIWNDLAILYSQKGDLEHTEIYLKKAAEEWGDQPNIHYNLAVVLAGRQKLAEAREEFIRAIRLYPGYLQARYELGETLEKLGRPDEADEQYREIIRISSSGADHWSSVLGQDRRLAKMIVQKAAQRLARNSRSK
ncbi:MAG: tetratricopeptide repeat protein [Nitrospirae bacterium]|nr:tetratricopeptide repeat protein [Nitrospirota bacterium]